MIEASFGIDFNTTADTRYPSSLVSFSHITYVYSLPNIGKHPTLLGGGSTVFGVVELATIIPRETPDMYAVPRLKHLTPI